MGYEDLPKPTVQVNPAADELVEGKEIGAYGIPERLIDAVEVERGDLRGSGDLPEMTYEEWGNMLTSIVGLYATASTSVGVGDRQVTRILRGIHEHMVEEGGVSIHSDAESMLSPDELQRIEAIRAGVQAETLNARQFMLKVLAMGFDWLEAHDEGLIRQS